MQNGHDSTRIVMLAEEMAEHRPCFETLPWLRNRCQLTEEIFVVGRRLAFSISNPVQAQVRRHAVQQIRRIAYTKISAATQELDEHLLTHFEGLIFILQELAATSDDHGTVPPE
jgi:hypothetical protein